MIERRGFCNRCGLCELGSPPQADPLIVWDLAKTPGEENACYHRLIRDLRNGRNRDEVLQEWLAQDPTFDGNMDGYLNFPSTPDAVMEGCNYRFLQDGLELPSKREDGGHWVYPEYNRTEPIILNDRLYGEMDHGD